MTIGDGLTVENIWRLRQDELGKDIIKVPERSIKFLSFYLGEYQ